MAIYKEKHKTSKTVFDDFTNRNIFKLISQGYFESLESPISIGKEANVFSALRKDGSRVAVKIYRVNNCDFHKMFQYMKEDPRFVGVKRRKRDTIFAWAKREFMNLTNAREAGVSTPAVYGFVFNILIMEFIGDEQPAPKLNKAIPQDINDFYEQVVQNYQKLYKSGVVHGDLSSFNILNANEQAVFIDMSQSTTFENPHAEEYLKRDCKNLATFFAKHNVKTTPSTLYKRITKPETKK